MLPEEIKITNDLNEFKRNVRPYIVDDNAYRLCRSYIKIKDFLEKEISGLETISIYNCQYLLALYFIYVIVNYRSTLYFPSL